MKRILFLFVVLISQLLHADILEEDFAKWKVWVRKEIKIPKEENNNTVKIKLKDGREFRADKINDGKYVIKMEFGSFTVNKSEIASIRKTEIRQKQFLAKLDKIYTYKSPGTMEQLKKEFGDVQQIITFIDWWLLYLEPDSPVLQDKLSLSRKCVVCKGAGKIFDSSNIRLHTCTKCGGVGRIRCGACKGQGVKKCSKCKGEGKLVTTNKHVSKSSRGVSLKSVQCNKCYGKKQFKCQACRGKCRYVCPVCKGEKKVRKPNPCKRCYAYGTIYLPPRIITYPFLDNKVKRIPPPPPTTTEKSLKNRDPQ